PTAYYRGKEETHVGQAVQPDRIGRQAGQPDLLSCRRNNSYPHGLGARSGAFLRSGKPQVSVKNPAVTMPPGAREEAGTSRSTTAKSGSLGTWRALFR